MEKVIVPVLLLLFLPGFATAQSTNGSDSSYIISLNQEMDNYVVQQQGEVLDFAYAADFVFSHGTGKIEGKGSWLTTAGRTKYLLRRHDSVTVELHTQLAIARGNLSVEPTGNYLVCSKK